MPAPPPPFIPLKRRTVLWHYLLFFFLIPMPFLILFSRLDFFLFQIRSFFSTWRVHFCGEVNSLFFSRPSLAECPPLPRPFSNGSRFEARAVTPLVQPLTKSCINRFFRPFPPPQEQGVSSSSLALNAPLSGLPFLFRVFLSSTGGEVDRHLVHNSFRSSSLPSSTVA